MGGISFPSQSEITNCQDKELFLDYMYLRKLDSKVRQLLRHSSKSKVVAEIISQPWFFLFLPGFHSHSRITVLLTSGQFLLSPLPLQHRDGKIISTSITDFPQIENVNPMLLDLQERGTLFHECVVDNLPHLVCAFVSSSVKIGCWWPVLTHGATLKTNEIQMI